VQVPRHAEPADSAGAVPGADRSDAVVVGGATRHARSPGLPAAPLGDAGAIDALLPQTQCTRCGYPDCRRYAEAIASGAAPINRCPPGGEEGVARLAGLLGVEPLPLDPAHGVEGPRLLAVIDEAWCIGCALCLKACPVDAIVGAAKQMHTVVDVDCTGCELCVPVCPVDCIGLVPATRATGWAAWSAPQAERARARYAAHQRRGGSAPLDAPDIGDVEAAQPVSPDPRMAAADTMPAELSAERKRSVVAAALEAARRARRA
jgi:Na+-translocating ferredoxin:NAD+ oxidoreductase subunit B